MQAVGKWSVFDLGIARVKGLEDLVEQGFGLRLKFLEAVFVFLPKSDMIIKISGFIQRNEDLWY